MIGWSPRCFISNFVEIGPPVLEMTILKGFYNIWAWRQSWSCDQDPMNILSFPVPIEAPYKISTRLAKRFQRRSLKLWTTTNGRRTIRKTCPCNVYPLEPHFYIAKLGYAGVYLFFLFLLQNIDCGYSLEPPR